MGHDDQGCKVRVLSDLVGGRGGGGGEGVEGEDGKRGICECGGGVGVEWDEGHEYLSFPVEEV